MCYLLLLLLLLLLPLPLDTLTKKPCNGVRGAVITAVTVTAAAAVTVAAAAAAVITVAAAAAAAMATFCGCHQGLQVHPEWVLLRPEELVPEPLLHLLLDVTARHAGIAPELNSSVDKKFDPLKKSD